MRNALSKKIVDIEPSGIRKFFDVVSEIPDAISLGVGEPDFDTPWNVREEGIYALEKGRTFYTSNAGLKELRQEISRYVARKYDTQYDPMKQVLVTVGGSEAIDVALRCMVDPGDEGLYHSQVMYHIFLVQLWQMLFLYLLILKRRISLSLLRKNC